MFSRETEDERWLKRAIRRKFGVRPRNIKLYRKAFTHRSILAEKPGIPSNERLEYLGDAVLDTIIAEHLFLKFPERDEGSLTRLKSAIVSRKSLSRLAIELDLVELIDFKDTRTISVESIAGNALEAFVGAVLLDRGYRQTRKFVLGRIVEPLIDMQEVQENSIDAKSELIIWGQRNRKTIEFREDRVEDIGHFREYHVTVLVNGRELASGQGRSKKKAEQDAAGNSLGKIGD